MSLFADKLTDSEPRSDSARLRMLYSVNNMLRQVEADGLDINVMLPRILRLAAAELQAETGSIFVLDETGRVEHAWRITEDHDESPLTHFTGEAIHSGLAGWVARHGEPAIVHNTLTDERWLPNPEHPSSTSAWSALCTPLSTRGRVVGVITLTTPGASQFTSQDQDVLLAIASQAAVSITNARLFESVQRQLRISALLNRAGQVVNSSLDIDEIMQSLLAQMNELLNAEALSIALVDHQTNELVYHVSEGQGAEKIVGLRVPANRGISGWVMSHGKPALVNDPAGDERFYREGDARTGYQTRAIICAPLVTKDRVLGTIQAINPSEGSFTEHDLQLLTSLASLAAGAFGNAEQFAATQAAEARYMGLFEDNIDPILLTTRTGNIIEVNQRACQFLGYERQELLEMSIHMLHSTQAAAQLSKRGKGVLVFTSEIVTKDGTIVPVEVHAKNLILDDQEILQWIERDISEQVELEQMREDLTAMLVHDLQSPLGNIISSLELVEMELPDDVDPSILSLLKIANQSGDRLRMLIRSLLDINRLEAGHSIADQQEIRIGALLEEACEQVSTSLKRRKISLVRQVPADTAPIYVDEDMIRRVIINLLDNAVKYTPSDRQIHIQVRPHSEDGWLWLAVSDEGPGIPPSFRRTIFDKFRRLKEKGGPKGLGLGLAFCRLAVEAHGGRIWIDDAPHGGARFNLTLPLVQTQE